MNGLKIAGGILSLVGAALVLLMQVIYLLTSSFYWQLIIQMILPIIALVGGILLLAGKRAGGILALIVGAIWLAIAILINFDLVMSWMGYIMLPPQFSFFVYFLNFSIWGYLFVEIVLVFVGGILGVAGGSD